MPAGVVFPIVFPVAENPVVSIVIPAYNNWAYTRNCLISIYQLTDDVSYEVIVGDNVSTDETVNLEKYFTNVVYLRNPENLGYIKNVNNAASHARGRFILTLNNDTTVTRGWLSSLVDVMDRDPKAGLVGSKLVYPNGLMQEAGGIIWRDASGWNYGREGNPEAPEYNYLKEVDYVSGASNLIRKEIWDRLKGLDERYVPAYFDDSDLAFSIRGLGYKTVYQPLSVVIHYEGMAHGTDTSSGTKKYQVVNREKFIEKWKAVLGTENFPNGENVFHARDKSKGKKTIVVIDHYVPHFDKDAGSRTTFQLLNLFVRLNYNVKFIGDNFYKHEPYTTILQQMGIEVLYGEYYRDNWKQWIINNKKYIDYFYVNRPHISIKYIDFLRQNTNAKIVYYGHDLHFVRERLQYEIEKDPTLLASIEQWKKTETEIIRQSDTVLTLSYDEKEIIEKEIGHADVRIMPAFSYSRFNEPVTNFDQRKNILFVGGFGHKPNVDAVLWFAREVFPLVRRELKDVEFVIAGSKPPKK
ncbi:glycosyltransferase [Puia sp. P3]|uniref:glycosyltransferase n=1 Tax=Puia sp. P3 TaxID=3423952 RepID=UPI003D67A67D